jgi:hypothetical protein
MIGRAAAAFLGVALALAPGPPGTSESRTLSPLLRLSNAELTLGIVPGLGRPRGHRIHSTRRRATK